MYSQTLAGLLTTLVGQALLALGVDVVPGDAEKIVGALITLGGLAWTYWGRIRQGDVTWYGMKKGGQF